jgi:hypothetical protein
MCEYPVPHFDQLQVFNSSNSRHDPLLDEVSDLEYLEWLFTGCRPASALILTSTNTIEPPLRALSNHAAPFELSPLPGRTPVENSEAQSSRFTDHESLAHLASLPLRAWLTMSHNGYDQHAAQTYLHVPDSTFNDTPHRSPVDETSSHTSQQMEANMEIPNVAGSELGAQVDSLPMNIMYRCQAQCGNSEW